MGRIKLWIVPSIIAFVLAIFVVGSAVLYNQVQNEVRLTQSSIIAKAIAQNLVNEIKNVASLLDGLSQFEVVDVAHRYEAYEAISKILINKYPGYFYAVNFVTPDGTIQKIFPVPQNVKALGRNLMTRPELKAYLDMSKATNKAVMSHRVMTYQGIYAVIIYQPLFDRKGEFKGWVNAVIDIDNWLNDQMVNQGWVGNYVQMHWDGAGALDAMTTGPQVEQTFHYSFPVLNQNIHMSVGLPDTALVTKHKQHLYVLWFVGLFLLVMVSYLLYRLTKSTEELTEVNEQLNLKSVLLNSLAHDISNPLATLGLTVETILQKAGASVSEVHKNRVAKSLSTLHEMLSSVRGLSRLELEKDHLKLQSVSLLRAVNEASTHVKEMADQKNVNIKIDLSRGDIFIQADESTLVNNVIPNILTNAIKFTKPHSAVLVTSEKIGTTIWLKVTDEGSGFSSSEIVDFNQGSALKSNLGTAGEVGSGLGLSQVKGFMHLYGGEATIENSTSGACIKLKFNVARMN